MSSILGRVVATERRPNTPHEFHFWTALDSPVGIGTIVRVDGRDAGRTGRSRTSTASSSRDSATPTSQSPLHDVLGHDGIAGERGIRSRRSARRSGSTPPPCCGRSRRSRCSRCRWAQVFLADEDDVAVALRMDGYLQGGRAHRNSDRRLSRRRHRRRRSTSTPISSLGPEAAHLNITGVSGLATKTSAVEWLLAVDLHALPGEKGSVAAVCFNVKGPDLCFLDQPGELDDADRALYEKMRRRRRAVRERAVLRAVQRRRASRSTRCARTRRCCDNVTPLTWGLREVLQYAEVLLNKDDVDAKADALIDFIKERVVDKEFTRRRCSSATHTRAVVRRPRGVVPRRAARDGAEGRRELAHAPRRDDPQGAQPALEHLARAAPDSSPTTAT